MAQLLTAFDATQVKPAQAFNLLPVSGPDGLPVVITKNEIIPTKDNSGGMLVLHVMVIDGEHKGAEGDYRLNLYNSSEQAVKIAYAQFSAICHVTGVYQVANADVLQNIPFRILTRLQKKEKEDAPDYTEIYGVKDINGNDPGKQAAPANNGFTAPAQNQQQPQQNQPTGGFVAPANQQPAPTQNVGAAPSSWNNPQAQQQQQAPANGPGFTPPGWSRG